jgi:hypothetical protein
LVNIAINLLEGTHTSTLSQSAHSLMYILTIKPFNGYHRHPLNAQAAIEDAEICLDPCSTLRL